MKLPAQGYEVLGHRRRETRSGGYTWSSDRPSRIHAALLDSSKAHVWGSFTLWHMAESGHKSAMQERPGLVLPGLRCLALASPLAIPQGSPAAPPGCQCPLPWAADEPVWRLASPCPYSPWDPAGPSGLTQALELQA